MTRVKKVCTFIIMATVIITINTSVYANTEIDVRTKSSNISNSRNIINISDVIRSSSIGDYKNELLNEKQSKQNELMNVLDKKVNEDKKLVTAGSTSIDLSIKEYSLDEAYKVNLITPLMITEYNKEQSFSSVLTDSVQWIVPVHNYSGENGHATLVEKNGTIEWIGTTFGEVQTGQPENIDTILSKISTVAKDGIQNIQYAYSQIYHITFIYFKTADGEFVIPYSSISDEVKFTNGNVYSAKKMFAILNKTFDETLLTNNNNNDGGLPYRNQIGSLQLIILGCISVATLIVIGFFLKLILKRKQPVKLTL